MVKRKKKIKKKLLVTTVIFIIILFGFLFFNNKLLLSSIPSNNLNNGIYNMKVDIFPKSFLKQFVITTTKSNYNAGEDIIINDYQAVDSSCLTSLRANFLLKKGINILDDHYETLPPSAYATMFYTVSFSSSQTKYWEAGTYTIESTWYCDGKKLDVNGKITQNSGATSISTFNIIKNTNNTPLLECPIRSSCGLGYELVNPNNVDCYCKRLWTPDNGLCETGETPSLSPKDCSTVSCQPDEIIIDNVCVDKSSICAEQGGTKLCQNNEGNIGEIINIKNFSPISIIIIIAGLGLIYYGWRKYA
ncbi:MAG: hypothetical protein QW727_04010 [Candidatus Pacearchaeota archaeon]